MRSSVCWATRRGYAIHRFPVPPGTDPLGTIDVHRYGRARRFIPFGPVLILVVVDGPFKNLLRDVRAWFDPVKDNRG